MNNTDITNIESLRKWFRTCPAILDTNRFYVDYLSESPTEYAIFASPSTFAYHENVLGERILNDTQTINFIFASKESYGADVQTNLANMGFYDEIIAWIIEQNNKLNFPQISNGHIKSILPTLTAYPVQIGSDSAKYQIQLQMVYKIQR